MSDRAKVHKHYPDAFALRVRRGDWRIRTLNDPGAVSIGRGAREALAWADAATYVREAEQAQ